jgi:membrane protease YdiL (CAAX protease family)
MIESGDRFRSLLHGLAEPVAAMVGAFLVTALLILPFFPTRLRLDIALRPVAGGEALAHEQLEREVEAANLADEVQVMLVEGASRLVLQGVDEPDRAEAIVGELLARSGFQPDEWVRVEDFHVEALLRAKPHTLRLLMSIQALVFLLAGVLLARYRLAGGLPPNPASRPRAVLLGVAAGVAAVVMSWVVGLLLKLVGLPVEEQAWLVELYSDPGMLLRISPWVVLIAPVSEEVFFRFYVLRVIAVHMGYPTGLVVSSLMFAMVHLNPSGILIYLGIGCVFAWVYQRTGRLIAPIVGHMTLNAIVLITTHMLFSLDV